MLAVVCWCQRTDFAARVAHCRRAAGHRFGGPDCEHRLRRASPPASTWRDATPAAGVKLEVLYFDGCPSHERLRPMLRELARRHDFELAERRIDSLADAQASRFLGSPSVRVDGRRRRARCPRAHRLRAAMPSLSLGGRALRPAATRVDRTRPAGDGEPMTAPGCCDTDQPDRRGARSLGEARSRRCGCSADDPRSP